MIHLLSQWNTILIVISADFYNGREMRTVFVIVICVWLIIPECLGARGGGRGGIFNIF